MKILGIDPSTKSTGVAIFENGNLIYYNCITASSSNVFSRIEKMKEELNKLLKEYKIDYIYMEDVLPEDVKKNKQVFKALMYLQGGLCKVINDNKIESEFFYPSEWRAQCGIKTGRGVMRESLKPEDIKFVKNKFNITVNDDIADAICIGYVGSKFKETKVIDGFEFN